MFDRTETQRLSPAGLLALETMAANDREAAIEAASWGDERYTLYHLGLAVELANVAEGRATGAVRPMLPRRPMTWTPLQ